MLTLPDYTGYEIHIPSGTVTPKHASYGAAVMDDQIGGFPDPYPMFLDRWWLTPGTVSGQPTVFPVYRFDGYPWDNQGVGAIHFTSDLPSLPSASAAATDVIAKTNPSRPDVSVPNFLVELKDIPEMLHLKGQEHHKGRAGSSAAEYNFGWGLLIQDLHNLLDFTHQVNNRVKELKALHSKGGIRRRRTVYSETVTKRATGQTFQSFNCTVSGDQTATTHREAWVTVRWKPDDIAMPSADDLLQQARFAVHGWDPSSGGLASVIWEAIPWSWLADYFGNMGTFLNASRNSVGAQPVNACYMVHTVTRWDTIVRSVSPGFSATPSSLKYETKSRTLTSASLEAHLPFINARQLANLLSIVSNLGR